MVEAEYIFLDLEKQRAVVVGGGQVAYQKTQGLVETGARIVVVTRQIIPELASLCRVQKVTLLGVIFGWLPLLFVGAALLYRNWMS